MLPVLEASIPPAVKVNIISDRTQTIRASVADVQFTLMLTVALVVMVIFLSLPVTVSFGAGGKSNIFCIWAMCDTGIRSRMFMPFLMA